MTATNSNFYKLYTQCFPHQIFVYGPLHSLRKLMNKSRSSSDILIFSARGWLGDHVRRSRVGVCVLDLVLDFRTWRVALVCLVAIAYLSYVSFNVGDDQDLLRKMSRSRQLTQLIHTRHRPPHSPDPAAQATRSHLTKRNLITIRNPSSLLEVTINFYKHNNFIHNCI